MTNRTRWGSVLGVMLISPWMAEMSWGGIPFTDAILVALFLGPMYGGAALLIREVTRRTGHGWPTILLLATAFGVFQAALVDQSLFSPVYDRYDFQHPVHLGWVDVSLYHLVSFVTGHVIISITVPIIIAEAWSRRPRSPWLSRTGVGVVATLYVLATVINHFGVKDEDTDGFQAAQHQVAVAALTVAALIVLALIWRRHPAPSSTWIPPLWLLAAIGFVGYLFYLPGEDGTALAVAVVVIAASCLVIGRWSRGAGWSSDHVFWLAMGVALTGMAVPYLAEPYDIDVSTVREAVNDTAAAAICLLGVVMTVARRRTLVVTSGP